MLASAGNNIILRIGWVYGWEGENFAKTILRRATERDELEVVDDQFGAPTSAELIADVTSQIVDRCWTGATGTDREQIKERLGIFNVAPMGRTSWHGYATELVREALRQGQPLRVAEDGIIPGASEKYPGAATRPKVLLAQYEQAQADFLHTTAGVAGGRKALCLQTECIFMMMKIRGPKKLAASSWGRAGRARSGLGRGGVGM